MRLTLRALALLVIASPVSAQDLKRPATWKLRLDSGQHAVDSTLEYVSMPPGWHVTTNRHAGIFYDPAWQAGSSYRVQSTIFLFPNSELEGYGLFVGGSDLAGPEQSYLCFLLRKDGKFIVKRRAGASVRELMPWTEDSAIVKQTGAGDKPVKNVLTLEATGRTVRFLVNGKSVTRQPIEVERVNGQVGLRVNYGINVHVTDVKIEPLP